MDKQQAPTFKQRQEEAQCFRDLLALSDKELEFFIDLYNAGSLTNEAMVALEAIDAWVGIND